MKTEFTETDLILEVAKLYNGYLTLDKAIKIYEMEYGIKPEIVESEKEYIYVGYQDVVDNGDMPDGVTVEHLIFMKDLQESGNVNMFAAIPEIEKCLRVDRGLASNILSVYMKQYSLLYDPGSMV